MIKEFLQVERFSDLKTDNEQILNQFLKDLRNRVVSVTPLYNTHVGGIEYVVVYWSESRKLRNYED